MSKNIIYLIFALFLFSCNSKQKQVKKIDFYFSKSDSIHAINIQNNLLPMYAVEGMFERKTITEMMKEDSIPGMSIAFIEKGKIVWTKHYGYANLKDSIPVSSETVFTGASLSKPITAIAALRLVEKGILNLDENVNLKLKEWKVPETDLTAKEKVTLRRLIAHKAGIKNDLWSSYLPEEDVPTLNQMLSGEKPSVDPATSVIFEPGSRSKYSNPGYSVIQKLLIDTQNQDFDKIIDELIINSAGMKNSSMQQPIPERLMQKRATGYTADLKPYPYRIFPYQAAGGIWTTSKDLAKFMTTLLDDYQKEKNILISKEMAQTIFTKETNRYVFSLWNWGDDIVFQHSGSNQGFNCFMYGSVDKQQGIVVMTNSDNAFGIFDYIQRAVNYEYDWEYVKPEIMKPTKKDISWADKYLGDYRWRGNDLTLVKEKKDLYLLSDNDKYTLIQTAPQVFFVKGQSMKITFYEEGYFKGMTIWGSGGGPSRMKKVK